MHRQPTGGTRTKRLPKILRDITALYRPYSPTAKNLIGISFDNTKIYRPVTAYSDSTKLQDDVDAISEWSNK